MKLTHKLREDLGPVIKYLLAIHRVDGLNHNRLSGAVLWKLQQMDESNLGHDQVINLATDMMSPENLPGLLQEYDTHIDAKRESKNRQVLGIIRNQVPKTTIERDSVIQETFAMIQRIPLARSICDIRRIVAARIQNGNQDLSRIQILDLGLGAPTGLPMGSASTAEAAPSVKAKSKSCWPSVTMPNSPKDLE